MNKQTIFALGFFDGVHLGHQTILYACQKMAKQAGVSTAAITFQKHPQSLFTKVCPSLINTTADRCSLLQKYGIDKILTYPVTPAVMGMPWRDFLTTLYRDHGARGFVCGDDFRFGCKGEGNGEKLQDFCREFGLACVIIPEQLAEGSRISSTRIRGLLENGNVKEANRLLGHPHILTGTVVTGRQIGRTIGIPTANLTFPEGILVPKFGVYATTVTVDGQSYPAVTNIGTRPTVNGQGITAECHLLDFEGDLYGREITVAFCDFLRPEQKFGSLAELKAQIATDIANGRESLKPSP